jgi:hypothetical protein
MGQTIEYIPFVELEKVCPTKFIGTNGKNLIPGVSTKIPKGINQRK